MDYSQFKGKPFQVISKLGVRYTGIFDSISQEDQTVCLSEVYNHGTEDRSTQRKLAGSATTLGWVRFHTESISSLDIVENHLPKEEEQVDPALASVHFSDVKPTGSVRERKTHVDTSVAFLLTLIPLVYSGTDLAWRRRLADTKSAAPPTVPNAEFDFARGTDALQADRNAQPKKASTAYEKTSFWDNLTTDTARVPRHEERGRNMDTFGEAGGQPGRGGYRGGHRGGYRGRGRGRS